MNCKKTLASLWLALLVSAPWAWGHVAAQSNQAVGRAQRSSREERHELREGFRDRLTSWQDESDDPENKFDAWRRLSPEEKAAARKNFQRWRTLTPEQREHLRERWRRWRALPPERREELRRRYHMLRDLPPEKRRELRRRFLDRGEPLSTEESPKMRDTMRAPGEPKPLEGRRRLRDMLGNPQSR